MAVFVPSMVVDFTLKFDELLLPQPPTVQESVDSRVPSGGSSASIPPRSWGTMGGGSTQPSISSAGRASYVANRVPMKADVTLPGFRQASTFSLSIDFRELPIDPRIVRSAAVDIHLGAVDIEQFHLGARMPPRIGTSRLSILNIRPSALGEPDTLLMTGLVDEWSVTHGPDGSVINMRGRDLRGVLLDTPIASDPKGPQLLDRLDTSLAIGPLVRQILSFHPLFGKFTVSWNPNEWGPGGLPTPDSVDVAPRHRKGARGSRKGAKASPGADNLRMSFWDLIVQYCYLVGAVPVLSGGTINIRPVRRLYDQQSAGSDPASSAAPFSGGRPRTSDAQSGRELDQPLRIRRLVYGRDVDELEFTRKYTGYQRPRIVRCVSVDANSERKGDGKVVSAFWPPASKHDARRTSVSPGESRSHEEHLNIPVPGVVDVARLEQIAKSVYEEIGRGEVGGSCSTPNLSSFGGDNADPDLLRLRPGDSVELGVDVRHLTASSPLVAELVDHSRAPTQQRIEEITRTLGDRDLAAAIVLTSRGELQGLQRFFRVSNVRYSWGEEGLQTSFDFQNYVELRHRADADAPAAPAAVRQSTP